MSEPNLSGLLLIISGPSGVGKTTVTRAVEKQLNGIFSVSMTTRPKAVRDRENVDYIFVDDQEFKKQRDAGNLLESAEVFGFNYGTPKQPVKQNLDNGELVLLEIDVQGAIQVKQNMPEALAIFLLPPGEQTLLDRLRQRKRDDEQTIQARFAKAKAEIEKAKQSSIYDEFIVNDSLEVAVQQTIDCVQARRKS